MEAYLDPLEQIDWSAVDRDCWWLPPDALSLAGVPGFEALPVATRQRLSHCEYLHLLQVGLWLEALFVERLALLAQRTDDLDRRATYLREIREEAGHSLMFIELMRRGGIALPASGASGVGQVLGRWIRPGSALFWAMVVIGEELPMRMTRSLRRGVEDVRLSSVVYRMAELHDRDEAIHAGFARVECAEATMRLAAWQRELAAPIVGRALRALSEHIHYPPAAIYACAGLDRADEWRAAARRNPARRALAARTLAPTVLFLRRAGWRVAAPAGCEEAP